MSLLAAFSLLSCGGGGGGGSASVNTSATSGTLAADCGQPGSRCTGLAGGLNYILYVPANFQPNVSGLVLALHPRSSTGEFMESLTRLNRKADEAGFAVLYPETGLRWWNWFFRPGADSEAIRTIISTVQVKLKADPKRIYATGYSDGAEMTHRIGVELGDILAAIAPVSGTLYEGAAPAVMPIAKGAVSVLILHADIPVSNSFYICGTPNHPSQDVIFEYWTGPSANNCSTLNTTDKICGAQGLLTVKKATGCKDSAEVLFYPILNGSHGWYNVAGNWSVPINTSVGLLQPYNPNFNETTGITTNDIIWNFFAAHPKP